MEVKEVRYVKVHQLTSCFLYSRKSLPVFRIKAAGRHVSDLRPLLLVTETKRDSEVKEQNVPQRSVPGSVMVLLQEPSVIQVNQMFSS